MMVDVCLFLCIRRHIFRATAIENTHPIYMNVGAVMMIQWWLTGNEYCQLIDPLMSTIDLITTKSNISIAHQNGPLANGTDCAVFSLHPFHSLRFGSFGVLARFLLIVPAKPESMRKPETKMMNDLIQIHTYLVWIYRILYTYDADAIHHSFQPFRIVGI